MSQVDSTHGRIYADQLPALDAIAAANGRPTSPAYRPSSSELQMRGFRRALELVGCDENQIILLLNQEFPSN
jgi:hypothetical protein